MKPTETRIFVKILHNCANRYKALAEVAYFKNEMTVPFYERWRWYFEYRAAILRVKYPKAYTELIQGTHEYTPKLHELEKKMQDKIRAKKGQITRFKSELKRVESEWREIWPIEENERYQNTLNKLAQLESELQVLINTKII